SSSTTYRNELTEKDGHNSQQAERVSENLKRTPQKKNGVLHPRCGSEPFVPKGVRNCQEWSGSVSGYPWPHKEKGVILAR
ncbi:MAG: hypothetical protein WCK63_15045, partial [Betaproteobacteria bacterium]